MTVREALIIKDIVSTSPEASKTREWLKTYDELKALFKNIFRNDDTDELRRIGNVQPTCAIMRYAIMKRMLEERNVSTSSYPEYHELFPNYAEEEDWQEYLLHRYGSRRYTP